MRAKPDMEPWVNRGHKIKSSIGAALLVPTNVIPQPNLTYGSVVPKGTHN